MSAPNGRNIVILAHGIGQRGGITIDERRSNIYKLYRNALRSRLARRGTGRGATPPRSIARSDVVKPGTL